MSSAKDIDFEKEIQPALKEYCYECHSEIEKKEKAGFVFDNLERLKKDIGEGRVIEPGKPGKSHFFEVIANPNAENAMPPDGQMDQEIIDKFRLWIALGAPLSADAPRMSVKKDLPPIMKWTNREGKSIKAGFERLDGEFVVLKLPTSEYVKFPLATLSDESQKLARDCATP